MPHYDKECVNKYRGISTVDRGITLVKSEMTARGCIVGIYTETVHPTFHDNLRLSLGELFSGIQGWPYQVGWILAK
jgi:hypothetical protein